MSALPAQYANVCRVANLNDEVLTLIAGNGAVAVRLKQIVPFLIEHFLRAGTPLRQIQVKVSLAEPPPLPKKPPARTISEAARDHIKTFAATLPPDTPLRASLETLAKRARSR
jgi:hypothetical protein